MRRLALAVLAAVPFIACPALAAPDTVYATHCAMCHQSQAQGLPGQFPQIAGRLAIIAGTAQGQHYLIRVLLNGLSGAITVNGSSINGFMPSFSSTSDQDIASALNHVIALPPASGKRPAPITAADVAKIRAEGHVSAAQVQAERQRLVAAKLVP